MRSPTRWPRASEPRVPRPRHPRLKPGSRHPLQRSRVAPIAQADLAAPIVITQKARRMLALMDRAVTLWHLPVIGRAKGSVIRRLLERHECERAVEIGSLFGYSAILIAGTMPPRG